MQLISWRLRSYLTLRELHLKLPALPPSEYSANRARGADWGRQYRVSRGKRGAIEELVALVKTRQWNGPAMDHARIEVHFQLPDRRRRDGLGLLERLKPWVDGLVEAGVIKDDALVNIGFPQATWEYVKGEPAATWILIIEEDETCKSG